MPSANTTPLYAHTCPLDVFLGSESSEDYYYCPAESHEDRNGPAVVVRRSADEFDFVHFYWSDAQESSGTSSAFRAWSLANTWRAENESGYTLDRIRTCSQCGGRRSGRWVEFDEQDYCSYCISQCCTCRTYLPTSRLTSVAGYYYCDNHSPHCSGCGEAFGTNRRAYTQNSELVCFSCSMHCQRCSEVPSYVEEPEEWNGVCDYCEERLIRGYGHTRPNMWLGGEEKPYYLGFELEVSATSSQRRKVKTLVEWSQKNLTSAAGLDLKEDSSVAGFEIASQPMTPEFFESVDWANFFDVLNSTCPLKDGRTEEPTEHGLHVHISRSAFDNDDVSIAAFSYLLGADDTNLVRISRREPYYYCSKIKNPVSEAIVASQKIGMYTPQKSRIMNKGIRGQRGAINLGPNNTIEVRSGASTRDAQRFINSVRLVYVAAEYIRYLRPNRHVSINPKALNWKNFAEWTKDNFPDAYPSISNTEAE